MVAFVTTPLSINNAVSFRSSSFISSSIRPTRSSLCNTTTPALLRVSASSSIRPQQNKPQPSSISTTSSSPFSKLVAACKSFLSQRNLASLLLALFVIGSFSTVSFPSAADAASTGGRVGGSNFQRGGGGGGGGYSSGPTYFAPAPAPVIVAPSPFFSPFGGYMMSPFFFPMGGVGFGGGFLTLLLITAFVGFVVSSLTSRFGSSTQDDLYIGDPENPWCTVTTIKIALLASAKPLQQRLTQLARVADTSTPQGLQTVLQETGIELIRNAEYYTHGAIVTEQLKLEQAEQAFNKTSMRERMKIQNETITNSQGFAFEKDKKPIIDPLTNMPAEYIVVSLCVANLGKLSMPKEINSDKDIQAALEQVSCISDEAIQAVEVIWAPQDIHDTLSAVQLTQDHPELKRI